MRIGCCYLDCYGIVQQLHQILQLMKQITSIVMLSKLLRIHKQSTSKGVVATNMAVNPTDMSNIVMLYNNIMLQLCQRWAQTYTVTEYHAAVNTNNGAEALNKVLKYKFLSLSSLATLLIESYFPEAHRNYLCMNYMQTNEYRKYKSIVPQYKSTILHCLQRKSKSCFQLPIQHKVFLK